jgi:DNA-binding transcriptional LysR family regulator
VEFRQLKYFESIVRNRKISKAAEELYVSQPSISAQLKALEKELDCKLIERTVREISLTEPGKVLYKHAIKILKQYKEAQQEIEDWKNMYSGCIYIGVLPTIVTSWLPEILSCFNEKFPDVIIHVKEMSSQEIQDSLRNFDIQLGITNSPINKEEITCERLIEEELLLVAPTDYKFNNEEAINLSDLKELPFILYEKGFYLREIILNATKQAGFEPIVSYENGRIETIRSFVSAGLGVSLIPETTVKYGIKRDLKVLRVLNPTPKRCLCIATHKNRFFSPAMRELQLIITDFLN